MNEPFIPNKRDRARFKNQCDQILDMLLDGPVTRTQLVSVARNVTARISQLRNRGVHIACTRLGESSETVYQLEN